MEKIQRTVVPELDEILGHPFKVLDDGFVRVVDYLGSDGSIVQAARFPMEKARTRFGGPGSDPLPDAELAHHAVRDVRSQVPRQGSDGLLEAVDTPQDGERQ